MIDHIKGLSEIYKYCTSWFVIV